MTEHNHDWSVFWLTERAQESPIRCAAGEGWSPDVEDDHCGEQLAWGEAVRRANIVERLLNADDIEFSREAGGEVVCFTGADFEALFDFIMEETK
jgi:hypothetical protein